jgi:hypothetical protein
LALAVPLSRFTSQVGGGSAFFVRHQAHADFLAVDLSGDFGGSEADGEAARFRFESFWFEPVAGSFQLSKEARAGFERRAR